MSVYKYAKRILMDAGCDEYTYGGEQCKYLMDDLKAEFPDGMEYSYVDVANAILGMSRPRPIVRAPYLMVWDNDSGADSIECESFNEALMVAENSLVDWMFAETLCWDVKSGPTQEQIENWDYMIYNFSVEIRKYNPHTDEYEAVKEFTDEELHSMGWDEYEKLDWPWTKGE